MEAEKELSREESLQIIQNMIYEAKNEVKDDSFTYLLWGWLVFIASLSQFILVKMESEYNNYPWFLMPIGGLITAIYWMRRGKRSRVRTHVSDALKFVWIAFGIALFIIMAFNHMSVYQVVPSIMVLYGIGLFCSGGVLKFRPLLFGGIFCWVCAIAGFQTPNIYLLLILATAVLGGYIIPGYLLKMNNNRK